MATTTITADVFEGGEQHDNTYQNARRAAQTSSTYTRPYVGQTTGSGYTVERSALCFDLSGLPSGITVNSANLKVYVRNDNSTTDFDFYGCEATVDCSSIWTNTMFNDFTGWADSDSAFTPTYYTVAQNTNGISTAAYTDIALTATGKSKIEDLAGGATKMKFIMLSAEDISASAPSDSESLQFYDVGDSDKEPGLYIDYTEASGYGNKVSTVLSANIGSISGIPTANIDKVSGV